MWYNDETVTGNITGEYNFCYFPWIDLQNRINLLRNNKENYIKVIGFLQESELL